MIVELGTTTRAGYDLKVETMKPMKVTIWTVFPYQTKVSAEER